MLNSDFKIIKTNIFSLNRVFNWQEVLIGVYINNKYYDRKTLSRKQLEFFKYLIDFIEGDYKTPISL